ncbi:MAG TPA: hypothetical protein VN231_10875 [Allosphingosinicella sp.]|nr:hypothetical protein [Allosphingosinicella sp.]
MTCWKQPALSVAVGLLLSGCVTTHTPGDYLANRPNVDPNDVAQYAAAHLAAVEHFIGIAGVETPDPIDGDWTPVVSAGLRYVDTRCQRFMQALLELDRARETASQQIRYTGAASAAVLTIIEAGRQLTGIAPLLFGLADQTVNNFGQGLLYELRPGTIVSLVTRKQNLYRATIANVTYSNRAAAMDAIGGYLAICLPATIESEVQSAIENSQFQRVTARPPLSTDEPPADPQRPVSPGATPPVPPPPPPRPRQADEIRLENVTPLIEQVPRGDPQ